MVRLGEAEGLFLLGPYKNNFTRFYNKYKKEFLRVHWVLGKLFCDFTVKVFCLSYNTIHGRISDFALLQIYINR